jgi:hypothetical protein
MKKRTPENFHLKDKTCIFKRLPFYVLLGLFAVTLIMGCKHEWEGEKKHTLRTDSVPNAFISIADSINYGVVVKPRNNADEWQKKWLQSFDRKELVDFIFDAVYSGRLQPYDYFDDKPITVDQVKELEEKKEFDRSKIGKIQFKERWFFDPDQLKMVKEVYSVMLAYEVFRDNGEFRGYKPAFKVYLNQSIK